MWTILLSVLGAIGAALVSLALWRYQLIGKRRYEIAEQFVTVTTRAVGALQFARSPVGYKGEGETRIRNPGEDEETAPHLNGLYIPIERLAKSDEVFRDLFRSQVLCEMHFGGPSGKPFKVLLDTHDEIANAAWVRVHSQDNLPREESLRLFRTIYGGDGDEITPRINAAFDEIKRLADAQLRPHWITLLLPFLTADRLASCLGKLRNWWNRAWGTHDRAA